MKLEENIKYLMFPLYYLYYIDDVYDESIYSKINIEFMYNPHNDSKVKLENILESLKWARDNSTYDFKSILSGLGYSRKNADYTNKDIYFFITHMYRVVETYLNENKI